MQARGRPVQAGASTGQHAGKPGSSPWAVTVEASRRAARLPTGTVTFLFTDVEGSTRAWIRNPDAMLAAMVRHDALIEGLVAEHGGHVVRPRGEGDSRFAVFGRATDGVAAACAIQLALVQEAWPVVGPLRVRMALHTGEADLRVGDYYGPAVNHCARLRAVAHGAQVLVSSVTADLVRESLAPAIGLMDLGEHQLEDLGRPEQVWQVVHPGLPAEFPPLRSLRPVRHNLPGQATSFIGRHEAIEAIKARLGTDGVRLLTVTGPGGIGKTRLAMQVAGELVGHFADGVCFVSLAAIADPELVSAAIAQTLGVPEVGGRSIVEELKEQLQAKELLLVLDNFEHLLASARLVGELLDACPRLSVLVTSRAVLRLAREHIFDVPPLAMPDPEQTADLKTAGEYEAIRLFCERAQAVQSDFVLTAKNVGAVAGICRRLDGLPLAIELAAARVRVFAPQVLVGYLSRRLVLLTGGVRDAPARHQTLRGAIAWSYDLLPSTEQRLFERLAVFAGGFTLEAAEVVADADGRLGISAMDGLAALVEQSLVRRLDGEFEEARFGLLGIIHEYASDRLVASGQDLATRERHAAYFSALAEAAEPYQGPRQAWWLKRLELEHDNLRAALRWYVERGQTEQALRLAGALSRFWLGHGHLSEGRERMTEVLRLGEAGSGPGRRTAARAAALHGAGSLALQQVDYAAARSLYEEELAIRRELGDWQGIVAALSSLGTVAGGQGNYAAARSLHEQSLAIRRELGDRLGIAASLNNLGRVAYHQGDHAIARSLHEESLTIFRELGDPRGIAVALINLGEAVQDQGDPTAARRLFEEGMGVARELGNPVLIAYALDGLAAVAAAQGQAGRALRLAGVAARLRKSAGAQTSPAEQQSLDRNLQPARQLLSEEAGAAAWAQGQAMAEDQAFAYALETAGPGWPPRLPDESRAPSPAASGRWPRSLPAAGTTERSPRDS